jgi:threonine/homoserine/homoserine lactone efflux protein
MNLETLLALSLFCFVSSITPGPNNLMLLSSGVNFGFRRSVPHMLGIAIGFSLMVFLVGIGISTLFKLWPPSFVILKWTSVGYLLYLAYKIANSASPHQAKSSAKPFSFIQAALFQWVNPKAWTMAVSVNAVYAPEQDMMSIVWVTCVYFIVNLPSINCWLLLGNNLNRFLQKQSHLIWFNRTMAVLLVVSFIPMLDS